MGQTFVDNVGVWADFSYTAGVNSSLCTGVSANGAYGSYFAGGTTSVSASGSIDFPRQGRYTAKRMRTSFMYAKFLNQCVLSNGVISSSSYQVRPAAPRLWRPATSPAQAIVLLMRRDRVQAANHQGHHLD